MTPPGVRGATDSTDSRSRSLPHAQLSPAERRRLAAHVVGEQVVLLLGEHLGQSPGQILLAEVDLLAVHRDVPRRLHPPACGLPADPDHDHADLAAMAIASSTLRDSTSMAFPPCVRAADRTATRCPEHQGRVGRIAECAPKSQQRGRDGPARADCPSACYRGRGASGATGQEGSAGPTQRPHADGRLDVARPPPGRATTRPGPTRHWLCGRSSV
jgi:hypothetical protein